MKKQATKRTFMHVSGKHITVTPKPRQRVILAALPKHLRDQCVPVKSV